MKRRIVISLILHILIILVTILASFMRFAGFRLFGPNSAPSDYRALRYFTVLSNLLVGIICVPCSVFDVLKLTGKAGERPRWLTIIEYIGASCLALTMITILVVLGPGVAIVEKDIGSFFNLYYNHNFFFHLLTPVAFIAAFLLSAEGKLTYKFIPIGVAPAIAYEAFYTIVSLSHMGPDGKVPFEYDWYGFMQGGIQFGWIAIVGMAALATLLAFLLIFFHKKATVS